MNGQGNARTISYGHLLPIRGISCCWLVDVTDDCAAELEATAVDPPGGGAAEPEAPDAIVTTGAEGASTPSDRTVIIASGSDSTSVREKRS